MVELINDSFIKRLNVTETRDFRNKNDTDDKRHNQNLY